MDSSQNVQIPKALFNDIMSFFCYLEFSGHRFPTLFDVHGMFVELGEKQHSINLRKAYTNIVNAKDDEQKRSAWAIYMNLKGKSGR